MFPNYNHIILQLNEAPVLPLGDVMIKSARLENEEGRTNEKDWGGYV